MKLQIFCHFPWQSASITEPIFTKLRFKRQPDDSFNILLRLKIGQFQQIFYYYCKYFQLWYCLARSWSILYWLLLSNVTLVNKRTNEEKKERTLNLAFSLVYLKISKKRNNPIKFLRVFYVMLSRIRGLLITICIYNIYIWT